MHAHTQRFPCSRGKKKAKPIKKPVSAHPESRCKNQVEPKIQWILNIQKKGPRPQISISVVFNICVEQVQEIGSFMDTKGATSNMLGS